MTSLPSTAPHPLPGAPPGHPPRRAIVPDPAWAAARPALLERLGRFGDELQAGELPAWLTPLMREVLTLGLAEAGADEGTIWLVDEPGQALVATWNNGPHAGKFLGHRQSLREGLVSLVFASEQPVLENAVDQHPGHSKLVDQKLQVATKSMLVVPFYFLGGCRGVISGVQLAGHQMPPTRPPGFQGRDLATLQRTAGLLTNLLDLEVLSRVVGWRGG